MNPKAKEKKWVESSVELLAAKNILASSLCNQLNDISDNSISPAVSVNGDTPLTSTWALCKQDSRKQLVVPITNDRPSEPSISGR